MIRHMKCVITEDYPGEYFISNLVLQAYSLMKCR